MSKVQSAVFALVLGLVILAHGVLRADTPYQIQPIVKLGDRVGDAGIKTTDGYFVIGTLNDSGQLVFITENESGGQLLIQSAAGKLTPIVARDGAAPGGKWSADVRVREPVSITSLEMPCSPRS